MGICETTATINCIILTLSVQTNESYIILFQLLHSTSGCQQEFYSKVREYMCQILVNKWMFCNIFGDFHSKENKQKTHCACFSLVLDILLIWRVSPLTMPVCTCRAWTISEGYRHQLSNIYFCKYWQGRHLREIANPSSVALAALASVLRHFT